MKQVSFTPLFILLLSAVFLASCSQTGSNTISTTSSTENSTSIASSRLSKTTSYRTDHGKHSVNVTFDISTTSDGTITGIKANMNSGDHESAEYIARFNNAATKKIIGQKISSLSLSTVGGASDTTDAFLSVTSSL